LSNLYFLTVVFSVKSSHLLLQGRRFSQGDDPEGLQRCRIESGMTSNAE